MRKYKEVYFYFQHLPPYPGAAARRAASLLGGFSQSESNCFVFTTYGSPDQKFNLKNFETICLEAPQNENKSSLWKRLYYEISNAIKISLHLAFKRNRKEILLILSSPNYFTCLLVGIVAKVFRISYVVDVRDIYPEVLVYSNLISPKSPFYKLLKKLTISFYQGAEFITATNLEIKKTIEDYKATSVVYNGYPSSIIDITVQKHNIFTVCFHGVLGRFQEIELLNEIINSKRLKHIQFIIIGYGPRENNLNYNSENIRFLGKLSPTDTLDEIAKCHLGLSFRTSDYISRRSFPVKNWEYLGLGIPVLNYPRTEAGDFCEYHDIGIVFDQRNVKEIEDKILELSKFNNDYERFRYNALKIRKNYTREKSGIDFYRKIMNL